MTEPIIHPRPRSLAMVGGSVSVPANVTISGAPAGLVASIPSLDAAESQAGWVRCALDGSCVVEPGEEAYHLEVDDGGVRLAARGEPGLRWALATLAQLLRGRPQALPCLVIDDAPAFAERGYMLDVARDRIPTMATLFDLVDRMASLKLNHLQLYHEHSFAYAGHEMVWRAADPVTSAETRALDAHCTKRGIRLCANQNSFGHFERWLRVPAYSHLGIVDGPWLKPEWGNSYHEATTLDPQDPGSIALVEDLFRQQFPLCSSPYANIGGDEPIELGRGKTEAICNQKGKGSVFSEYLAKVVCAAERTGKRPQFWCDPHPNEDDGLPRDLVALVWEYDEPRDFAPRLAAHSKAGREVWVAPGTSTWNSMTSRSWNRRANLARAAREGLAHGARGFLNTEWGDAGNREQWPLRLFGMADGAGAAWTGPDLFDDVATGLSLFGNREIGSWLAALGDADKPISSGEDADGGGRRWNCSALHQESIRPFSDKPKGSLPAWERVAARCSELAASLPPVGGLVERECRHASDWAVYTCDRILARMSPDPAQRVEEFRKRACPLIGEYRKLWLERSRYGGLEDSCQWWRRLVQ